MKAQSRPRKRKYSLLDQEMGSSSIILPTTATSSADLINANSDNQRIILHLTYCHFVYPFKHVLKIAASYSNISIKNIWKWVEKHRNERSEDVKSKSYRLLISDAKRYYIRLREMINNHVNKSVFEEYIYKMQEFPSNIITSEHPIALTNPIDSEIYLVEDDYINDLKDYLKKTPDEVIESFQTQIDTYSRNLGAFMNINKDTTTASNNQQSVISISNIEEFRARYQRLYRKYRKFKKLFSLDINFTDTLDNFFFRTFQNYEQWAKEITN
uniref:Homeobox domain-containing protein n=1 Tax=Rhabditophanes sp. KR3021 TaxID=114890 RepID=A0AC35U7Z3_9BILA